MNAEQWNQLYPVGTLVFAYPGFRPEDDAAARRLVTRTRTAAQVSTPGDPVVWVEGEGAYICLTHVDPVSEDVWEAARTAEKPAEPEAAPETPARLSPEREAEIAARAGAASPAPWFLHDDWPGQVFSESQFNHHIARVTGSNPEPNERFIAHARTDVPALLAELAAVRAERDQARARIAELEYIAPSPSCTRCYGADAERFVAQGGATVACAACGPSEEPVR